MIKRRHFTYLLLLLLTACSIENTSKEQAVYYFNLKDYFTKEVKKLNLEKPSFEKTVIHNNKKEKKILNVADWEAELASFIESDINKPAWKESYFVDSSLNKLTYLAKSDDLKTRSVEIFYADRVPVKFIIHNNIKNFLYKNNEQLTYIPDSLYEIKKNQQVILLGENQYKIKGVLK